MLKVGKNQNADSAAQLAPKFDARAKYFSALLIQPVGQLQYLMNKKSEQIEKEKGHRQVVLAMAEVVFNVIRPGAFGQTLCQCYCFNRLYNRLGSLGLTFLEI